MIAARKPVYACTHCDTDQHTTARHDAALAALRREEHSTPYVALGLASIIVLCIIALAYVAGLVWIIERFGGL